MHYGSQPADPLLNIVDASSCVVMASIGSAGVDRGMSHTRLRHMAMKAPLASDRLDPAQIRRPQKWFTIVELSTAMADYIENFYNPAGPPQLD
jgi:hypothetical protein